MNESRHLDQTQFDVVHAILAEIERLCAPRECSEEGLVAIYRLARAASLVMCGMVVEDLQ